MIQSPTYLHGFGNHHESEALPGALPIGQNTPQVCPYKLYAEQLSGTAFTVPRHANQRSVCHKPFKFYQPTSRKAIPDKDGGFNIPNQLRWNPFDVPNKEEGPQDFIDSLALIAYSGDPASRHGLSIFIYTTNVGMERRAFYNADGDMLIVPEKGAINVTTEFGMLVVSPKEVCVIQRCIRFRVEPADSECIRGYILEVFDGHFELPDLGPIGANGLANPQDFVYPSASYEDDRTEWKLISKYMSDFFIADLDHSPFDVVAWRGTAIADFVIFPPRWAVATNTFRPPYYHRNVMSEFMGLICGQYEAKKEGFLPGGGSLHSAGSAHGPDARTFEMASREELKPVRVAEGTMAFMFESSLMLRTTRWAMEASGKLQEDYNRVWEDIRPNFTPNQK